MENTANLGMNAVWKGLRYGLGGRTISLGGRERGSGYRGLNKSVLVEGLRQIVCLRDRLP